MLQRIDYVTMFLWVNFMHKIFKLKITKKLIKISVLRKLLKNPRVNRDTF